MRTRIGFRIVVAVLVVSGAWSELPSEEPDVVPKCDGIEVAGLCDPYVPGTMIQYRPGQPFLVVSTWPDGPAEKAGVCPGDEMLSVNGLFASKNPMRRMLREIASDSASPVNLRLRRGNEEMNLEVPRVRESTLAKLSKRRFLKADGVEGGIRLVPIDQSHDELKELERFQERIDKALGFKTVEGFSVPHETADGQVEKVFALHQSDRVNGVAGFANSPESYTAGFSVYLLKDPEEVWVYSVMPGSPAHRAGLLPGDSLVELDGNLTKGIKADELDNLITKPNERRQMKLKVTRGEKPLSLELATQKLGDFTQSNLNNSVPGYPQHLGDDYFLGIEALHVENPRQAIVADMEYPSPAFDAGLHVGDLIISINSIPVEEIDRQGLTKILTPGGGSEMTFEVSRLGKRRTFRVSPVTYRTALASIGRKLTKSGPAPQQCPENL